MQVRSMSVGREGWLMPRNPKHPHGQFQCFRLEFQVQVQGCTGTSDLEESGVPTVAGTCVFGRCEQLLMFMVSSE